MKTPSSKSKSPPPTLSTPVGSGESPTAVVEQPMVTPAPKPGEKLTRHGQSSGRPGQIVTAANRWRENYNPARALTIRRAVELLELGQRGDFAYLQWTYRKIERSYPTLSGLISRCEAPLAGFDWHIKVKNVPPPGMDAETFETCAAAQKATLENAYNQIDNLVDALSHLHSADFRGYAHLQKHRDEAGAVTHLEPLHQWCVCRDGLEGNWFWNPDSRSTSAPVQFLGKKFLIGGDALPGDDFIIRECPRPIDEVALVLFIRNGLCEKDWDAFIEVYGLPGGVVEMPQGIPPEKVSEYETAAKQVAEGGSGAIPAGAKYYANDGPRGVDPFTPRLKHLDECLILAGTGGKLTMMAESGSGTLAGGAHETAFNEIANGRARAISECFQRQLDPEILAAAHPGEAPLVYFCFGAEENEDVTAIVTNVVSLKGAGYKASAEWVAEKTSIPVEEVEPPPALAPFAGTGKVALADDDDEEDAPEDADPAEDGKPAAITNRAPLETENLTLKTSALAEAIAADLAPLRAALAKIEGISDEALFAEKLREFIADHGPLTKLLADINAYPKSAKVLATGIRQEFVKGLSQKSETQKLKA